MQKWEYCVLGEVTYDAGHRALWGNYPKVSILTPTGRKERDLTKTKYDEAGIGVMIAILGSEGWEMIGTTPRLEEYHLIYFKRPVEATDG